MTGDALLAQSESDWVGFWQNLEAGHDSFDVTGAPPKVAACNGKYVLALMQEKAVRPHRRMVLIDRLIPFLPAGVGLLALIGAVVVQWRAEATARRAGRRR